MRSHRGHSGDECRPRWRQHLGIPSSLSLLPWPWLRGYARMHRRQKISLSNDISLQSAVAELINKDHGRPRRDRNGGGPHSHDQSRDMVRQMKDSLNLDPSTTLTTLGRCPRTQGWPRSAGSRTDQPYFGVLEGKKKKNPCDMLIKNVGHIARLRAVTM